jgi:predicted RNA binding protein YcfA (HicA-like mRNA interferase family)
MPKLKTLSGKAVVKIFSELGFDIVSQRGSHVKLGRINPDGSRQTLTVPVHDELDKGTLSHFQAGFAIHS